MSGFRTGTFNREAVSPFLRRFCPSQAVDSILEIDPAALAAAGKKLIMLDVDNTLLVWRSEDIPATTHDWVDRAQAAGLKLCILSNTRNPGRLDRLATAMDIPYYLGKFKPSTFMYQKALQEFGVSADDAIMIGDQIFTDILGANRTGIDAIWVRQMAPVDFVGTKISRMGEKLIRGRLYRSMTANDDTSQEGITEDLPVGGTAAFALFSHPTVRQFIKFVIIGGGSTVIDVGIYWVLMFYVPYAGGLLSDQLGSWLIGHGPSFFHALAMKEGLLVPKLAAGPVFKVFSSSIAILNSFWWNRAWTFKIRGTEHRSVQLRKFFAIALIGMILNTVITSGLGNVIPGHEKRSLAVASAIATVIVAFWNFFGQKFWTFKQHPTS